MAFTNQQRLTFFTDNAQLAISINTIPALIQEGITHPEDLEEFEDDDFKLIIENLRKPPGLMPDPNHNDANVPAPLIPRPAYVFGAKNAKRIKIAANAVRYYSEIDRVLSPENMHYTNVLKEFHQQWQSLLQKREDNDPVVPCISKSLPIMKWTESFKDFLGQVVGQRMIPLVYLTRENEIPSNPAPPLLPNCPYSEVHGSIEGELIARASFTHTLFKDDDAKLFQYIEEATRTTQYAASIRPFASRKQGRAAYQALLAQYAGKDKWQQELKTQEAFIHTRIWKGNSNFSLEAFITQHRNAHVRMERCAEVIPHQLPNERTRVIHLLDAIQCHDTALQAALAHVASNDQPGGMMERFEETAAYLLKFDPVAKKRKTNASGNQMQQISSVSERGNTTNKFKPNKGSTGVELRYHRPSEYRSLSDAQRDELKEYRRKRKATKYQEAPKGDELKRPAKKQKITKKHLIAALKELADEEDNEDDAYEQVTKDWVLSMVNQSNKSSYAPTSAHKPKAKSALQRIVDMVKAPS